MTKGKSHRVASAMWEDTIKPAIKSDKTHVFTSRSFPELAGYAPRDRGAIMRLMEGDGILAKVEKFYGDHDVREYRISEVLASLLPSRIETLDYAGALKKCSNRGYV